MHILHSYFTIDTWYLLFSIIILHQSIEFHLYYKALCLFHQLCFLYVFCMFSVCFLSGELVESKNFIWIQLNEDWHFSLWHLYCNLNWKRTKIIFQFFILATNKLKLLLLLKQSLAVIEPATLTERCIKCWKRTSYLLKRMLGINSPT